MREQWDRTIAWVAAVAGAVALLLGYLGISRTPYTPEQIPYLVSGGAFGLFMLGLAAVLWITADLRDEWRKLDDLDAHLEELIELAHDEAAAREREAEARNAATGTSRARPPAASRRGAQRSAPSSRRPS
ncbi:MAG TPA: hypothetical protein VHE83_10760 [Mycobacteriales bacterium]|nr:hypothetical protein [Mycobacteriales bacterium]